MKPVKILLFLLIAIFSLTPVAETKAQSVTVSFSNFQQQLSPYGRWVNNPRFGQVWIYNNNNFRPYYSDGHWEYTNYGWSWVSDYDWGWAPFHYGRWEHDPYYGWMWIPGYEWSPGWVSWSSYDDYYGWAPLGYGVNINVSFGSIPYNQWIFIPRQNICDRDINRYYISPERNRNFRNAVVINNYYEGSGRDGRYMRGPERREVERYTNNKIEEHKIDNREREGNYRNRNENNSGDVRNANDNNRPGKRTNDVFTGNDNNNGQVSEKRKQNREMNNNPQSDQNGFPERRQNDNRINRDNNNRAPGQVNENRKQNREINPLPPINENRTPPERTQNDNRMNRDNNNRAPGQVNENRKQNREINPLPPINENRNPPVRRQEDNQMNRDNNQQNNFPVRQQEIQRPVMQQKTMERSVDNNNGQRKKEN